MLPTLGGGRGDGIDPRKSHCAAPVSVEDKTILLQRFRPFDLIKIKTHMTSLSEDGETFFTPVCYTVIYKFLEAPSATNIT
jgi:hypothetical protein